MQPNPAQRQLKLEVDKDLQPTYSNTAIISHSQYEVVLDFVQILPSDPRARVLDRVIMNPVHAKLLLMALQENIGRYEARFGVIQTPPRPPSLADQLFNTAITPTPDEEKPNE